MGGGKWVNDKAGVSNTDHSERLDISIGGVSNVLLEFKCNLLSWKNILPSVMFV